MNNSLRKFEAGINLLSLWVLFFGIAMAFISIVASDNQIRIEIGTWIAVGVSVMVNSIVILCIYFVLANIRDTISGYTIDEMHSLSFEKYIEKRFPIPIYEVLCVYFCFFGVVAAMHLFSISGLFLLVVYGLAYQFAVHIAIGRNVSKIPLTVVHSAVFSILFIAIQIMKSCLVVFVIPLYLLSFSSYLKIGSHIHFWLDVVLFVLLLIGNLIFHNIVYMVLPYVVLVGIFLSIVTYLCADKECQMHK